MGFIIIVGNESWYNWSKCVNSATNPKGQHCNRKNSKVTAAMDNFWVQSFCKVPGYTAFLFGVFTHGITS